MRSRLKFSKEAINEMFELRASGWTMIKIAKKFGCSDHFISQVIGRHTRQDVPVPDELVAKAQAVAKVYPKRKGHAKRKTAAVVSQPNKVVHESLNGNTVASAVAKYAAACVDMDRAYQECRDLDIPAKGLHELAMMLTNDRHM